MNISFGFNLPLNPFSGNIPESVKQDMQRQGINTNTVVTVDLSKAPPDYSKYTTVPYSVLPSVGKKAAWEQYKKRVAGTTSQRPKTAAELAWEREEINRSQGLKTTRNPIKIKNGMVYFSDGKNVKTVKTPETYLIMWNRFNNGNLKLNPNTGMVFSTPPVSYKPTVQPVKVLPKSAGGAVSIQPVKAITLPDIKPIIPVKPIVPVKPTQPVEVKAGVVVAKPDTPKVIDKEPPDYAATSSVPYHVLPDVGKAAAWRDYEQRQAQPVTTNIYQQTPAQTSESTKSNLPLWIMGISALMKVLK